jgi:hypothetical protein
MARYWGARGTTKPPTKAQRREAAREAAKRATAKVAKKSDKLKTRILARAIVAAAEKRGSVVMMDGTQAGLSESDVSRLWDPALDLARRIEPGLSEMAVTP